MPKSTRDAVRPSPAPRWFATAGAIALLLSGCAPRPATELDKRAEIVARIRAVYAQSFDREPPSYVVLVTPHGVNALSDLKQREYWTVRELLDERGIPHETWEQDRALIHRSVPGRRHPRDVMLYDLPPELGDRARGGTILYLRLGGDSSLYTTRNPLAGEYDLTVHTWSDPVRVSFTQ